ncbi:MAG: CpXC domain-containing protein [Promethearchaeota archaeon]
MTRISSLEINCDCGNTFKAVYYASINTFIDPDFDTNLIRRLIDGTLHNFKCDRCGKIHHISMKVLINCPKAMFWVSTNESPENLKKILTHYGVLDKEGNVVDGFTEKLESWLKKSPEERKREAEAADEQIKKLREEFFDDLKKALENPSDEQEKINNNEDNEVN